MLRYDFTRRERFTKDQLRALELLYERFAGRLSGTLSAYLRTTTGVLPVSLEQLTYGEFLTSRSEATALWSVRLEPGGGVGALELNPDAAYALVYTMMGGRGASTTEARALSEIELALLGRIVNYVLQTLSDVCKSQWELRFSVLNCDTRPQMLGIASGTEPFVFANFQLGIGTVKGSFTLGMPASTIEAGGIRSARSQPAPVRDPVQAGRLYAQLERVALPVTVECDSTIPASEVVALRVGDVVSIGVPVKAEVDVRVSNTRKFAGRLVAGGDCLHVLVERGISSS